MHTEDVTTKDGTVKHVVAGTAAELAEAVKVLKNDETKNYPDIDNPDHGNYHVEDFANGKVESKEDRAETSPTSEESKKLSKKLASAESKKEKREILGSITSEEEKSKKAVDKSSSKK